MGDLSADSIRVLHVDDDPDLAEVVAMYLEREDDRFEIETVTSPDEGRARLADGEFDCVVSDYDMPGEDGIEFLESVRAEYPDLPFILYTGKGSEEVASDAISAGVTEYMQKETGSDQYTVLANRIENSVEQYRVKAEARRTRRRLREITESTTDCRWLFSDDWDELLFVSGYEDVWGRPTRTLEGEPRAFLDAVHEADREAVERAMDLLSEGASVDIEYRILRGDDGTGWVWMKGEPVFDDDGTVVRIVGFTRDVTERKERERELERTTERMAFALRNTNAGIWELDPETEAITSYPDPCPILETGIETAADFFGTVHPDDRSRVETAAETVLETGDATCIEYRTTSDVAVEWVESQMEPVTDADGAVSGLTGLTRDITERKEWELELRDERAVVEQALDALDELFYVVGPDGEMRRWNERLPALTGYTDEEIADMHVVEFFPEDERDRVADAIEAALTTGHDAVEAEIRAADGDRVPHEFTGTRLTDADGTVTGFVGTARDVSDRTERDR